MENYKGIYYNESKEQKYFEGGAHFKYKDLFMILKALGGIMPEDKYFYSNIHKNIDINKNKNSNIYSFPIKEKDKKLKPKTRNILSNNYANNPNTKKTVNSNKVQRKAHLSINNFNRIKSKNIVINEYELMEEKNKNNNYNNGESTLVHPNTQRYHTNNNFIKTFLNKKNNTINNKKNIVQKINSKNDINTRKDYVNILNYLKFIHHKNKSDAFVNNYNNNQNNNIQLLNNMVIRKKNTTFSEKNNINNNKKSIEMNSNNINTLNINGSKDKNLNIKKNNCLMVYGKSKINLSKVRLNTEIYYYENGIKKSRNIFNKNILTFKKTFENQKSSDFKTNDMNNNNDDTTHNILSSIIPLNNNTLNYNNSIENNNSITNNINNNKTLNLNKDGKNIALKKYIKKKINQCYDFNKKNIIKKNGKKISRNINNNFNSNYNEQNFKFKTSSDINNINKFKLGK